MLGIFRFAAPIAALMSPVSLSAAVMKITFAGEITTVPRTDSIGGAEPFNILGGLANVRPGSDFEMTLTFESEPIPPQGSEIWGDGNSDRPISNIEVKVNDIVAARAYSADSLSRNGIIINDPTDGIAFLGNVGWSIPGGDREFLFLVSLSPAAGNPFVGRIDQPLRYDLLPADQASGQLNYWETLDATFNSTSELRFNFQTVFLRSAVPEPAMWAMMIGGFGIAGAAARRTRARSQLA